MNTDWMKDGACKNHDPELWHPTGTKLQRTKKTRQATAICGAECPVRDQCLTYALTKEPYGTWGGMSEEELITERRRRGMPDVFDSPIYINYANY